MQQPKTYLKKLLARLVSALVLSRLDYCNAVYIDAITAGSSCHGSCVSHPVRLALVADQAEDRAQGVPHWSYISDLLLSERQAAAGRQNLIYTTKTLYGEVDIRCR